MYQVQYGFSSSAKPGYGSGVWWNFRLYQNYVKGKRGIHVRKPQGLLLMIKEICYIPLAHDENNEN
jgi:hypothetical protein